MNDICVRRANTLEASMKDVINKFAGEASASVVRLTSEADFESDGWGVSAFLSNGECVQLFARVTHR